MSLSLYFNFLFPCPEVALLKYQYNEQQKVVEMMRKQLRDIKLFYNMKWAKHMEYLIWYASFDL